MRRYPSPHKTFFDNQVINRKALVVRQQNGFARRGEKRIAWATRVDGLPLRGQPILLPMTENKGPTRLSDQFAAHAEGFAPRPIRNSDNFGSPPPANLRPPNDLRPRGEPKSTEFRTAEK